MDLEVALPDLPEALAFPRAAKRSGATAA